MLKICAKESTEHPIKSFCAITLHLDGVQCFTRLLEVIPNSLSCTQINPLQEHIPVGNWAPSSGVLITSAALLGLWDQSQFGCGKNVCLS